MNTSLDAGEKYIWKSKEGRVLLGFDTAPAKLLNDVFFGYSLSYGLRFFDNKAIDAKP